MRFIKNILKKIISFYGYSIIDNISANEISQCLNSAVNVIGRQSEFEFSKGVSIVVFSKDRPLQLYGLIESYFNCCINPVKLTILYQASNDEVYSAYKKLIDICYLNGLNVLFVKEKTTFKSEVVAIMRSIETESIFFLVDDIVFISTFNMDSIKCIDSSKFIFSLRHSTSIAYSYTLNQRLKLPLFSEAEFGSDLIEFDWFSGDGEWSDPWSLDGQLLNTKQVLSILEIIDFNAPNSFENCLKLFNKFKINKKGLCYTNSKIVNIPVNRVQLENDNKCGSVTSEYLLEKWNNGFFMDWKRYYGLNSKSTHVELPIYLKK